ncbi:MAG: hypothetical protein QNJ72_38890 [Pleurocapsa sp. MO_226.B13]|nr:hypothetical protein [Pleurocapsa sp. MO_226.B13]
MVLSLALAFWRVAIAFKMRIRLASFEYDEKPTIGGGRSPIRSSKMLVVLQG